MRKTFLTVYASVNYFQKSIFFRHSEQVKFSECLKKILIGIYCYLRNKTIQVIIFFRHSEQVKLSECLKKILIG